MVDKPEPIDSRIFKRGNPAVLGDKVERRFLKVLGGSDEQPFQKGSGRLEFARKIASEENPLTARVLVNRVWHHHFGKGIVRTPSDFGLRGDEPTHPELLDYLASRFIERGWSIKALHRLIMNSQTYQQTSDHRSDYAEMDPENKLLWRYNRQRLDFEAIRDSVLAASSRLDLTMGGPAISLTAEPAIPRRTVYGFIERQNLEPLFRIFDFASPDTTNPKRFTTTVPQQSLFMMNSDFMNEQARHMAKVTRDRVKDGADAERIARILHRMAFGRDVSGEELDMATAFIAEARHDEANRVEEPPTWQYGYGDYEPATAKLKTFTALPHFTGGHWQNGPELPNSNVGYLNFNTDSGHVGNGPAQDAVRRWRSPITGTIEIDGALNHLQPEKLGDGVQGWVVSSRSGELGHWTAHNSKAETKIWNIAVEQGELIDFIVDCRTNASHDTFYWLPVVRQIEIVTKEVEEDKEKKKKKEEKKTNIVATWDAKKDFSGPPPEPLSPIEQYAQVLLMTNEFVFVD
jgi:hypothetical protein